jgi:iron complex transport system ATP-binding protein
MSVNSSAIEMRQVGLTVGGKILTDINWDVPARSHWAVLGANGSGKTSLLSIAGAWRLPSSGTVKVLGETFGRADLRLLRQRIGYVSQALTARLRGGISVLDIVKTGLHGALEVWWHEYERRDDERARALLNHFGIGRLANRQFETLSQGERQRALIARLLMPSPEILIFDEPGAGLDLRGRELLLGALNQAAGFATTRASVLASNQLEDIPRCATHCLLLSGGKVLASGPIPTVLTSAMVSECFGIDSEVTESNGRWSARIRDR